ncbi:hypothetical protein U1Q18_021337, partial [Sarracenia purpurea var. burkii]
RRKERRKEASPINGATSGVVLGRRRHLRKEQEHRAAQPPRAPTLGFVPTCND